MNEMLKLAVYFGQTATVTIDFMIAINSTAITEKSI